MSFKITFEVEMDVRDDQEAALIFEAARIGLAAVAIKDRVLYRDFDQKRNAEAPAAPSNTVAKELKKIDTPVSQTKKELPKPERSRGIMGRSMLKRG